MVLDTADVSLFSRRVAFVVFERLICKITVRLRIASSQAFLVLESPHSSSHSSYHHAFSTSKLFLVSHHPALNNKTATLPR